MTRRFYKRAGITIYHGNWRELRWLLDEVDVIVTDPPYGQRYRSKRNETVAGDRDTRERDDLLDAWGERPALVFGTWKARQSCGCSIR